MTLDVFLRIPIDKITENFLNNLYNNENCKDIVTYILNNDNYEDLINYKDLARSKYIDKEKMRKLVFSDKWDKIDSDELYKYGNFDYQTMLYVFNKKKDIYLDQLLSNPNIYPNILMKFGLENMIDTNLHDNNFALFKNPVIFKNVNIIIINNEKVYLTDEQLKEYTNIKLSLANLPNEISDLILYKYYNED